jgi:hypothetical protein
LSAPRIFAQLRVVARKPEVPGQAEAGASNGFIRRFEPNLSQFERRFASRPANPCRAAARRLPIMQLRTKTAKTLTS